MKGMAKALAYKKAIAIDFNDMRAKLFRGSIKRVL